MLTFKKYSLPAIAFLAGLLIVSQVDAQSGARSAVPTQSFSAPMQSNIVQPDFSQQAIGGSSTRALPSPQQTFGGSSTRPIPAHQAPVQNYSQPAYQQQAQPMYQQQSQPMYQQQAQPMYQQHAQPMYQQHSAPIANSYPQYTPNYSTMPSTQYYQQPMYSSPVMPSNQGGCGCRGY